MDFNVTFLVKGPDGVAWIPYENPVTGMRLSDLLRQVAEATVKKGQGKIIGVKIEPTEIKT